MTRLSPEQFRALQKITSDIPTQAAAILDDSPERVRQFFDNTRTFIRMHKEHLCNQPYILLLHASSPNTPVLTLPTINRNINIGNRVFYVDETLRLDHADQDNYRVIDCERRTGEEQTLGILVHGGTYIYVCLCGKLIDERDIVHASLYAPRPSKWYRPVSDFDLILDDHKCNCIDREQQFTYWKNKADRILVAEKTDFGGSKFLLPTH